MEEKLLRLLGDGDLGDHLMQMEYIMTGKSIEEVWGNSIDEKKVNAKIKKKKERYVTIISMLDTCINLLNTKGLPNEKEDVLFLLNKIEEYIGILKKDYKE